MVTPIIRLLRRLTTAGHRSPRGGATAPFYRAARPRPCPPAVDFGMRPGRRVAATGRPACPCPPGPSAAGKGLKRSLLTPLHQATILVLSSETRPQEPTR